MEYISRRLFLRLCTAASAAGCLLGIPSGFAGTSDEKKSQPEQKSTESGPKIGLALGAGGAVGLSHILMLEAFDELGIKPQKLSGSSIGAIIGALYASGKSAKEIRAVVDELVIREHDTWKEIFLNKDIFQWAEFLDPELGQGGLISGDAFLAYLYKHIGASSFDELKIPLAVVATDFWKREQVIYDSGELLSAIQGSMALPGLFTPVKRDGRILIDGGAVNPVPYDILTGACEKIVAINVAGKRSVKKDFSFLDAIFSTFEIMQHSIMAEKYKNRPPDIIITPEIKDVRALEFHRIDVIYEQALPAKDKLKRELDNLLSG
ncbi:MAG: patatin-like phospholipase family protein [Desulfobacterales bacterium]